MALLRNVVLVQTVIPVLLVLAPELVAFVRVAAADGVLAFNCIASVCHPALRVAFVAALDRVV